MIFICYVEASCICHGTLLSPRFQGLKLQISSWLCLATGVFESVSSTGSMPSLCNLSTCQENMRFRARKKDVVLVDIHENFWQMMNWGAEGKEFALLPHFQKILTAILVREICFHTHVHTFTEATCFSVVNSSILFRRKFFKNPFGGLCLTPTRQPFLWTSGKVLSELR